MVWVLSLGLGLVAVLVLVRVWVFGAVWFGPRVRTKLRLNARAEAQGGVFQREQGPQVH